MHQNNRMSLPSVFNLVSSYDAFWGDLTLDTIRMIGSTCKGFQSEMLFVREHALIVMIKSRPQALGGWALSFSDAKYRFSLSDDILIEHCSTLPVGNKHRICLDGINQYKSRWFSPSISFMDAYQLAVNHPDGGLRFCMKQRHEYDIRVIQSAIDLLEEIGDRISWMVKNTVDLAEENERLRFDIRVANLRIESIRSMLMQPSPRRILQIENNITSLNSQKQALFERFGSLYAFQ